MLICRVSCGWCGRWLVTTGVRRLTNKAVFDGKLPVMLAGDDREVLFCGCWTMQESSGRD